MPHPNTVLALLVARAALPAAVVSAAPGTSEAQEVAPHLEPADCWFDTAAIEAGPIREPGKLADLILVEGDPTTGISDIPRVVTVIRDGRVYDPAATYRALGFEPCCQPPPPHSTGSSQP
jgi:hypothetical protein